MVMHTECLVVKTVFWVVSGVPVDLSLRVNSYWCGFCQPSSWRRLWCMCDMNAQSWWSDVELTQSFWWTSSFVYLSAYLWMRKCVYMRVSFTIALCKVCLNIISKPDLRTCDASSVGNQFYMFKTECCSAHWCSPIETVLFEAISRGPNLFERLAFILRSNNARTAWPLTAIATFISIVLSIFSRLVHLSWKGLQYFPYDLFSSIALNHATWKGQTL